MWKWKDTTLREFEEFLTAAFESRQHFIALRVIRQSLLTFVCTIPSWLVEEIIEYVNENDHFLQSKGVVAVIINENIIFNIVRTTNVILVLKLF